MLKRYNESQAKYINSYVATSSETVVYQIHREILKRTPKKKITYN